MQQELLLAAIVLLAVAVLAWWFLPRKAQRLAPQKVQRLDPKKAQREFLHRLAQGGDPGLPHQKAQRIDPIEHEFNSLFMTTTKEGKRGSDRTVDGSAEVRSLGSDAAGGRGVAAREQVTAG